MGKNLGPKLAKPDDPIFKEGLTIFTPARPGFKPQQKPTDDKEPPKE